MVMDAPSGASISKVTEESHQVHAAASEGLNHIPPLSIVNASESYQFVNHKWIRFVVATIVTH